MTTTLFANKNDFHLNSKADIALLEADEIFASEIINDLEKFNYKITHYSTGLKCLSHLAIKEYDLCIFNWNLPDISSMEIMIKLKKFKKMTPIIFISESNREEDIVQALSIGADDYIIAPPSIPVLHARIQALLRRFNLQKQNHQREELGYLTIDYYNKIILYKGENVSLTGAEKILAFDLFMHLNKIVTRRHLYELLGINDATINTRRLDVHISHLRKKLALNVMNGWRLSSIYQRGYRLEYLGL